MRRFSSYGPIDSDLHYFAHRKELIDKAYTQLTGNVPGKGGYYITIWAPRQTGKTWVMQEVLRKIAQSGEYETGILSLEAVKQEKDEKTVVNKLISKLTEVFQKKFPPIEKISEISTLFTKEYFQKPVILILDEFDSLEEDFINRFASIFRDIFIGRINQKNKESKDKTNLLHGLGLVGVHSVLGIKNVKGSPFNVQRSLHIPNLTYEEVKSIFKWYEKESGQKIEPAVIDKLYYEIAGQPGLTCWLGELLTEGLDDYKIDKNKPLTMRDFEIIYAAATYALPNNNILNIISKAKQEPNKERVLEMFQTDDKLEFRFDDEITNALYMNGIATKEVVDGTRYYLKFSSPFVQKRLFNHFSYHYFRTMGTLVKPFVSLDNVITPRGLNIKNLMKLYRDYLQKNREWLFKDVPRRSDLKIYEAVFHFNLFTFIDKFLKNKGGSVIPEFPTGNGKIDLIVRFIDKKYGLELKSYTDETGYRDALTQSANYGKQLKLKEIYLLEFVPEIDKKNREKYEQEHHDKKTGVTVIPVFIETGN
ncbi:MAG: hypothetical protein GY757_11715 [bacterium]|nr:hypothetical protein [bacterium]